MQRKLTTIAAMAALGASLAFASGAASAHERIGFGVTLGIPAYAPAYYEPVPYVSAPAYYAPARDYYEPRVWHEGRYWREREWREHEWREHEWRRREWREHDRY